MTTPLIAILLVFFALMVGVLVVCLRTRKIALSGMVDTDRVDNGGNRMAYIFMAAIISGALLALITAYLVFFRK